MSCTFAEPIRDVAALLMYAALRWVEAHGGTRIVAMGLREVAEMYVRVGLRRGGEAPRGARRGVGI